MGLKAQQIVFSYENVIEDNVYRMFHDKTVTDSFITALDILSSDSKSLLTNPISNPNLPIVGEIDVNGAANALLQQAASRAINEIVSKSSGLANRLFLGNVYGFSAAQIASQASQGVGGLISIARGVGGNTSEKNNTKKAQGNMSFDESASKSNDNGPNSTSQGKGNPNASLSNG
jgi:hypothetical protein